MGKYQFLMTISISELIYYPDEYNDNYVIEPVFQELIRFLDINIPIHEIVEQYFNYSVDTGDILVFKSSKSQDDFLLIDTFKGATDQIDLIRVGVSTRENRVQAKYHVRKLYDKSDYGIHFAEGQSVLSQILKNERNKATIHGSYEQKINYY